MDWLMTDDQKEAWEIVRRINAAWLEGHPERLDELFHDRVVIVGPDGTRYGEGKEAVVESYRSFGQQATIADYRESDGKIDVYRHGGRRELSLRHRVHDRGPIQPGDRPRRHSSWRSTTAAGWPSGAW